VVKETHRKENEPSGASRRPSKDTLNLVIAVCAVLISAASFIATYVQSKAALQEVKAETWPYLQIDNGNFDSTLRERVIYVYLENAGVGPAQVKQFSLFLEGKPVTSFYQFVRACCEEDWRLLAEQVGDEEAAMHALFPVTDSPAPALLPAGSKALAFSVPFNAETEAFWRSIDEARRGLTAEACYCSLLDECYRTNFEEDPVPVQYCRLDPKLNYQG